MRTHTEHAPEADHFASADVSNIEQLYAALDVLRDRLHGVDGCVTAAGICYDKSLGEHTANDWDRQLSVNVNVATAGR